MEKKLNLRKGLRAWNCLLTFLVIVIFGCGRITAQILKHSFTELVNESFVPPGTYCSPIYEASENGERTVHVAMDSAGNYVATWGVINDGMGGTCGVYKRRFNKNGMPLTGEILIDGNNTYASFIGGNPDFMPAYELSSIAMNPKGDYVIAFTSGSGGGVGGDAIAVRYDAAGVQQGAPILVGSSADWHPGGIGMDWGYNGVKAAMDDAGNFVVVCNGASYAYYPDNHHPTKIYYRRYDMNGNALGEMKEITSSSSIESILPDVAMNPKTGDFVIAWQERAYPLSPSNPGPYNLKAQQFTKYGVASGNPILLASNVAARNARLATAVDGLGNFAISWGGYWTSNGSLFDKNGVIKNSFSACGDMPNVCFDNDGDFLVTTADIHPGGCTALQNTVLTRFDQNGNQQNVIYMQSPYLAYPYYCDGGWEHGVQKNGIGAVVMNDRGDCVLAWNAGGAANEDNGSGGGFPSCDGRSLELIHLRYSVNTKPHIDASFCVSDTVGVGTIIGTVQATNERTQTVGNYSITGGNTGNAFAINAATGVITVINPPNWGSNPTYTLTVSATDNGNALNGPATGSGTVIINTIVPPAVTSVTPGAMCYPAGGVQLSAASTGGTPQWFTSSTGGTPVATYTTYYAPVVSTTTYYVANYYLGCESTTRIPVVATVWPLPNVVANTNYPFVCANEYATFNGSGASSYAWTNIDVSSGLPAYIITDGVPVNMVNSGTFSIEVMGTDANGCVNRDTISYLVKPLATMFWSANPSNTVCLGNQTTITATVTAGPGTYTWTGGITNGVAFTPTVTTTYTVNAIDTNGCRPSGTQHIIVNSLPVVTATATSDTVILGNQTTLNGDGASSYAWTGGISDGIPFSPTVTETYTVTGTDANGCQDTATKQVVVIAPLPIELLAFDAKRDGEKARLSWSTATETNNKYFSILRSSDAQHWTEIGRVKGAGNSSKTLYYNYTDEQAAEASGQNGLVYYQLKQTDFNGHSEHSGTRVIAFGTQLKNIRTYPNPVQDVLNIELSETGQMISIEIRNAFGQMVYKSDKPGANRTVNTTELAEGMYVLRITCGDEFVVQKFVKAAGN